MIHPESTSDQHDLLDRRTALKGTLATVAGFASAAHAVARLGAAQLSGIWSGTLAIMETFERVRLLIEPGPTATLVNADAGSDRRRASRVRLSGDRIVIDWASNGARFEGTLVTPFCIEGGWYQGDEAAAMTFVRGDAGKAAQLPPLTAASLATTRLNAGLPALGAAWAAHGRAPTLQVNGVRSVDATVRATVQDLWHLGSITKSMTATLVARAVDAGELHWDDTVGKWLSSLIPGLSPAVRMISFLELLSHRSGLARDIPDEEDKNYSAELTDPRAERLKYAARALSLPLVGSPGAQFAYSNLGFVVAGAMLEARCGKPWEQLLIERVCKPLGLPSTGFGPPGHVGLLDEPVGHASVRVPVLGRDRLRPHPLEGHEFTDNVMAMGPAGRVHMSLPDLIRYLQAHRDRPAAFLRPDSWDTLHTPTFGGNYALGWFVRPDGLLWHHGSNGLWYAEVAIDRPRSLVAAAVCNDGDLSAWPVVGRVLQKAEAAAAVTVPTTHHSLVANP